MDHEKIPNDIIISEPSEPVKYDVTIWFPDGVCIPSTNYLYKPGIRAKRFPYLYKEETIVTFQNIFIDLAKTTDLASVKGEKCDYFDISLDFLIRDRFWNRDVSNMVKSVEDAIVTIIGIDDSRVIHLHASKEKQQRKQEGIKIHLELYNS